MEEIGELRISVLEAPAGHVFIIAATCACVLNGRSLNAASYTASFVTNFGGGTTARAEAALLAGMLAGRPYVNVHSTFAPAGEIRGFLREAPEPATLLLLGTGAAVVAARRRRRSPAA
jgi:hypothetical protein